MGGGGGEGERLSYLYGIQEALVLFLRPVTTLTLATAAAATFVAVGMVVAFDRVLESLDLHRRGIELMLQYDVFPRELSQGVMVAPWRQLWHGA